MAFNVALKQSLLLTPGSSECEVIPSAIIQSALNIFSSLSPVSDSTGWLLKASQLSMDWGDFRPLCFQEKEVCLL